MTELQIHLTIPGWALRAGVLMLWVTIALQALPLGLRLYSKRLEAGLRK